MKRYWFTKDKLIIITALVSIILLAGVAFAAHRIIIFSNKELNTNEADFYINVGNMLYQKGLQDDAAALMIRGLEKDPNNHILLHNIGVYYNGKDDEKAAEYFQKAIAADPTYEKARNSLAVLLHSKGKYDAAIAQLRELIKLNPMKAAYHYDLGINLADQVRTSGKGSLEEAITEFETADKLEPGYAASQNNIEVLKKIAAVMK